jgi:hypothetical protein
VLESVSSILKEAPAQLAGVAMDASRDPAVRLAALTEMSGMVAATSNLKRNRRLDAAMRIAASDAERPTPRAALHRRLPGPTPLAYIIPKCPRSFSASASTSMTSFVPGSPPSPMNVMTAVLHLPPDVAWVKLT